MDLTLLRVVFSGGCSINGVKHTFTKSTVTLCTACLEADNAVTPYKTIDYSFRYGGE